MQKKNISLLGITVITFICFIISTFGFGFKYDFNGLDTKGDLSDLKDSTGFGKDSYGLMVSGLVFISLTIILAGVLIWLSTSKVNVKDKDSVLKWIQISIYGLILLSIILVLSGEALLFSKTYNQIKEMYPDLKFGDVWNSGYAAGTFIFTLLPLPLLAIPYFIKK